MESTMRKKKKTKPRDLRGARRTRRRERKERKPGVEIHRIDPHNSVSVGKKRRCGSSRKERESAGTAPRVLRKVFELTNPPNRDQASFTKDGGARKHKNERDLVDR